MLKDERGVPVTASNGEAVRLLDDTVAAYCGFRSDTGDRLKAALTADPGLAMGHILRGDFMLLFAKRELVAKAEAAARAAAAAMREHGASPREELHLRALEHWIRDEREAAVACWNVALDISPRDLVALKLGHYVGFYLGDAAGMRAAIERALPGWDAGVPGYGWVLGCHAFALEESGAYAAAERTGRRAIELNPADAWAAHAVAHVMEMEDRPAEGIAWIAGLEHQWAGLNNFVFHIRWHRCLFLLEERRFDEVLALYDLEVRAESTDEYIDITNAVALLWRLEQAGVAVGGRWGELAERSAARIADPLLEFAEVHYAMAAAAANDEATLERWRAARRTRPAEVATALGEATVAHRGGEWAHAVERILPVRDRIRSIGGSHAQRDLFEQLLVDAAIRAEHFPLARTLLAERKARRPRNAWGERQRGRIPGD